MRFPAELVPGWSGWAAEADPDGIIADAETFMRYLVVLRLAVSAPEVPEALAGLVASVDERLSGWGEEVAALVAACAAELDLEQGSNRVHPGPVSGYVRDHSGCSRTRVHRVVVVRDSRCAARMAGSALPRRGARGCLLLARRMTAP